MGGQQAHCLFNRVSIKQDVIRVAWLQAAWIGVLHQKNIEEWRIHWPAGQHSFSEIATFAVRATSPGREAQTAMFSPRPSASRTNNGSKRGTLTYKNSLEPGR
jgi:hypothetical protein